MGKKKREFKPPVDQGVPLGAIDAHVHLCRGWTLNNEYLNPGQLDAESIAYRTLAAKQNLTGILHAEGPAYEPEELFVRMNAILEAKYKAGERVVWAVIDTSPDLGRRAIDVALKLRAKWLMKGMYVLIGAYPIFGYKHRKWEREQLIRDVAQEVQFLCCLPERDERSGHDVTFERHLRISLEIAHEHHLPIHVHLDQTNTPWERGTERLIETLKLFDQPEVKWEKILPGELAERMKGRPSVWAVHAISPSCYPEKRFNALLDNMLKYNVGVICCPVAGLSMRQLDVYSARTHNCLARIPEMVNAGLEIMWGTDNIGDPFVPTWCPTLDREILVLTNALRFYDYGIIRKQLLGLPLTDVDRDNVRTFLQIHRQASSDVLRAHPVEN